ncbi:hypothetical protein AB0G04_22520 [Actinoplanes sp. NPDC023801]|uniref:hypothetical protein n=1 Tax=Actinoplanes sp. NPDC023801 TaxID=3154595 RepID=UPI0033E7EF2D
MPIDTRLDGDPASLFSGAHWLRGRLGAEADGCATALRLAGDEARHSWVGAAGAAFSERMAAAAVLADGLRTEAEAAATTFTEYGRTLATAQGLMQAARSLAAGQGLVVAGTTIYDPIAPDPLVHAQQRTAYMLALQQVTGVRTMMASAQALARARQAASQAVPPIGPTDVVGGAAGQTARLTENRNGTTPVEKPGNEPAARPGTEAEKPADKTAERPGAEAEKPADKTAGQNLPAHERAHIVQQRSGADR